MDLFHGGNISQFSPDISLNSKVGVNLILVIWKQKQFVFRVAVWSSEFLFM